MCSSRCREFFVVHIYFVSVLQAFDIVTMAFFCYADNPVPPPESWEELQCCICLSLPVMPCMVPHHTTTVRASCGTDCGQVVCQACWEMWAVTSSMAMVTCPVCRTHCLFCKQWGFLMLKKKSMDPDDVIKRHNLTGCFVRCCSIAPRAVSIVG
jgi:hypothetical protein